MPGPSSDFPSSQSWLQHRVSYGETDCMGVVYYANYLHWFERGRTEMIRQKGMSYAQVEKQGVILPVREARCRYFAPARYDDLVWIHTGIDKWTRTTINFIYEVLSEDKSQLLVQGHTQLAVINTQGRPVRMPEWLQEICRYEH